MARRHKDQIIRPDSVSAEDLEVGIDDASILDRKTFLSNLLIRTNDISDSEVQELLKLHLNEVSVGRPAENVYAFSSRRLCLPDVTFWSIWDNENIAGCGALLELSHEHGEIKSVRTVPSYLRRGVASHFMRFAIQQSVDRGYERISIETGASQYFEPAHRLYERFGFTYCEPFSGYTDDPSILFLTLELNTQHDCEYQ